MAAVEAEAQELTPSPQAVQTTTLFTVDWKYPTLLQLTVTVAEQTLAPGEHGAHKELVK